MKELKKLKELTQTLTSNGYLTDQTKAWRYAFDSVKELVCITNTSLRIKFINKLLSKKLHLYEDDYINRSLNSLFSRELFSCNNKDNIDNEYIYYGETYIEELYGWYEYYRYPIENSVGKLIGYTFMFIDISIRKQAIFKLEESEERFHELFNHMTSGVIVYKKEKNDFIIVDFNNATAVIENLCREDVIGKRFTTVFPEFHTYGLLDILHKVYLTEIPENFPIILYDNNKISSYKDVYIYKLKSGEIVTLCTDNTKHKQLQQELQNSQKLLKEVLDTIPDIINVQNADNTVIMYNKAGLDFFDLPCDEIIGKKCYKILGRNTFCSNCQTSVCKSTKKPAKCERFIKKLNGWYDCRSYPILDEHKNVINIIEHLRRINNLTPDKQDKKI